MKTEPIEIWVGRESGTTFLPERKKAVDAEVFGKLAIHPAASLNGTYTISHIPTGWAVERNLTREQAIEIVVLISTLNWDFEDKAGADPLRQAVQDAIARVRGR